MNRALARAAACTAATACCWPAALQAQRAADVDHVRLLRADREPGNWMTSGRTYQEQRFSPLTQIDDDNVARLGLAWYVDLNTHRGVEATPLVVDGVLYTTSAWNITYALDAKTGTQLWKFDPEVPAVTGRLACCDIVSRGLAAWEGKIIVATLDGRLIALDAATGKPIWTVATFDESAPYTITGAPRVFDGKVLIGNSGAELGVRGFATAYDVNTGRELWRFYTVPGDPSHGFENPAMEMAAKTWSGEWWKQGGGGTVWDSIVYDPDLDLVYLGVGNGGPWVQAYRSPGGGDNLFLASIVAVKADTGEYVWHYQEVPGDQWDYTATQPMILADLEIDRRVRKVLMQAPKNGFFYVLDRATGELLSAAKFAPNYWASHVDLKTSRPVINPAAYYDLDPVLLTPAPPGAHNWNPMSYSPITGLVYFPVQEVWLPYSRDPGFAPTEGRQFRSNTGWGGTLGEAGRIATELGNSRGRAWLTAWDPVHQREAWRVDYPSRGSGGVLATAGNLVVQGTVNQTVAIYRADDGEKLWEMPVQTIPVAGPISYTVDGEQYIALSAGFGGGNAMLQEIRTSTSRKRADGRLLAFKLGGTAQLPPLDEAVPLPPGPPAVPRVSEEVIENGNALYHRICAGCHGIRTVSNGVIKDLRHMTAETHAAFDDIVLRGKLEALGMASFADVLSQTDADAIHAYVIARANEDWGRDTRRETER
jgi:quinohemoprotein ethanol dehydrogenase